MIEVINPFQFSVLKVSPPNREDLCSKLCEVAFSLEKEDDKGGILSDSWDEGIRASNTEDYKNGGYTSFYSQNIFKKEELKELHDTAIGCFYEYAKMSGFEEPGFLDHSWLSVYRNGHRVPKHIHANAHLSCVFYGASVEDTGHIVFYNPALPIYQMTHDTGARCFVDKVTLPPEKGCFYIFPSFMQHETKPHCSEEPRVIYSANFIFTKSRLGREMWRTLNAP